MIKIIIDHESFFYFKSTVRDLVCELPIKELPEKVFWASITEKDEHQVTIELDGKFIIKFVKQVAWALPSIVFSICSVINSLKALDKNLGRLLREKDEEQQG